MGVNKANPVIRRWMAKAIGPVRAFFILDEFLPKHSPGLTVIFFL